MTATTSSILSPVGIADYTRYIGIAADPSVGTYDDEFPKDESDAKEDFIATMVGYLPGADPADWQEYAIRGEDGGLVGMASFRILADPAVTLVTSRIGVHLGSSWRGRGYASKALAAVLGMLRDRGVTMAEAIIDPENTPSRKLFERAGFTQCGILGGDLWYHLPI